MQKFVGVYIAVAAAAISLASYSAAQANSLPSFTDDGVAYLSYVVNGVVSEVNDPLPPPGPFLGGFVHQASGDSSSTASIDDVDSARLTASATNLSGPGAGAIVDLEFYFRVTAPQNYVDPVPVSVAGSYFMTAASSTFVSLSVCPIDCNLNHPVNYPGPSAAHFTETGTGYTGGTTNYKLSFNVSPDVIYEITMVAQAAGDGSGQSITAWIDPIVSVDPSFQLELSHGISNVESATPLPAALPLFAAGLGAMGVLGWRRKRKEIVA